MHTSDLEDRILTHVANNPATSMRKIAAVEGVPQSIVWRVLHKQCLHPYHLQ
jgi:hypothetical protein